MDSPHQYEEFHPCMHRWTKIHPEVPPKPIRSVVKPLSEKIDLLAKPLCRRLINLFLNHSETLGDVRRSKLVSRLVECGFTEKQLKDLLQEEKRKDEIRQRLADAGPFDIFDEHGNLMTPYTRGTRIKKKKKKPKQKGEAGDAKKKTKPSKSKDEKDTTGKEEDKQEGDGKKKKGKEKSAIGKKDKLKKEWPHTMGVQLMLQACWLADSAPDEAYISIAPAYFDVQASALLEVISDALGVQIITGEVRNSYERRIIKGCLNLAVWLGKSVTTPALLIDDQEIPFLLSLRGEVVEKKEKVESEEPEAHKSYQRGWAQPEISSAILRDHKENDGDRQDNGRESENANQLNQFTFQQLAKWYTPNAPEFLYAGPRNMPENVTFVEEGDDCKSWRLENVDNMEPQRLTPNLVPSYYPQLREDADGGKRDFWYIMNQARLYQEENLNWATHANFEIIQMIFNLIGTMVSTPDLTIDNLVQYLEEICQTIPELSEEVETEDNDELIDSKRTIILERLFLENFSKGFRDLNGRTPDQMRIICRKGAVLIRYLYEHTAVELWKQQMNMKEETPPASPSPILIQSEECSLDSDWEEWEEFVKDHLKVARFIRDWKAWLSDSNKDEESHEKVLEEVEKWLIRGKEIQFLEEKIHQYELEMRQDQISTIHDDSWAEVD